MSASRNANEPTAARQRRWVFVGVLTGLTVFCLAGAFGALSAVGATGGLRMGAILGSMAAAQTSVIAGRMPLRPLTIVIAFSWAGALAPLLVLEARPGTVIAIGPTLVGGVVGASLGLAIAHVMMRSARFHSGAARTSD